ncbi:hypothetical protein N5J66_07790 [Pseudomonas juntendi]|jgi:hypothetical protein|uniref:SGNH/GDSL hydrolase family protein n=1 Tax=Pseudomonas juntendi TaxID=2666183 RepID=A0ABZ2J753_9PSED|nr:MULTISPECIES: hypothetical protein [Pseudomonas]EGB96186.1 hypothetical protein G1E_24959 [Pseudomonas sp. TJI-51]MBA6121526.1 hypothetical protein [Pseudomonas juntendi]MBI6913325.1 hypothetical protein [Pseudomonas juntendi]MBS6036260.1 hypothetical protein [Pseudomonas sp.]MCF3155515.1 hypothetical protein [Pseudomonas juntendi]
MNPTHTSPPPSPLPQDYQRFLLRGSRRAPHTMHVHETSYRSGTINTDALGLRYSHCAGKRFSAGERGGASRINLLVGGSTALGIGASSDEHTVASHLSMLTGEVWLSLAGCGLNASQELLLFLTHQHRLGQLGHVVVLSGLNSLAHEALCEVLASPAAAHGKAYQDFLNSFSEGLQPATAARRQSLWRRIGQALAPPPPAEAVGSWPLSAPEKRLARAADTIGRTLRQWDRLLADSHATLTFILQPLLPWCRETLPAGEQAMLAALEQQPGNFDRLLDGAFDSQLHSAFFRRIKSQADPVPCYDMNGMLSSSPVFGADLFIDRLHLNDLGNNALAKVITAKLGLAQEKHAQRNVTPIRLV